MGNGSIATGDLWGRKRKMLVQWCIYLDLFLFSRDKSIYSKITDKSRCQPALFFFARFQFIFQQRVYSLRKYTFLSESILFLKNKSVYFLQFLRNIHPFVGESLHHYWKRLLEGQGEVKNKDSTSLQTQTLRCISKFNSDNV